VRTQLPLSARLLGSSLVSVIFLLVFHFVLFSLFSGDYLDSAQFNTVNLLQYNNRAYDRLTIRMLLERQPQFYLSKIVSGSMLLVYMCVWVFSLAVDEADRMMVRTHEGDTQQCGCGAARGLIG
jgi:hypothetical protein